ncbi:hypothetical protein P9112_002273 [Eukaryota sp. TZLM1-RC]
MLFSISPPSSDTGGAICKWRPDSNMIAVSLFGSVSIYDRQGSLISAIPVPNKRASISWEFNGDFLAISVLNQQQITLFESASATHSSIPTARPVTSLAWSPKSSVLAIGTDKGAFFIYDSTTKRMGKFIGKHQKRITKVTWTPSNLLVLASEDKTISISKPSQYESIRDHVSLPSVPSQVSFTSFKSIELCLALCSNTLYSFCTSTNSPLHRLDLTSISVFEPLPDLHLITGQDSGNVSILQLKYLEQGQLSVTRVVRHHLLRTSPVLGLSHCFTFSKSSQHLGSCSVVAVLYEEVVELISTTDWSITSPQSITQAETGNSFQSVTWGSDGGILTVSTVDGHVFAEATRTPVLTSSFSSLVAHMTSLYEVTIFDCVLPDGFPPGSPPVPLMKANLTQEPAVVVLGSGYCLAVCINSLVWYYQGMLPEQIGSPSTMALLGHREYLTTVDDVALTSDHVIVRMGKRALLHSQKNDDFEEVWFPLNDHHEILDVGIGSEFVAFGTNSGLILYSLVFNSVVVEISTPLPLTNLYPNSYFTRIVTVDLDGNGSLINPVTSSVFEIPEFPSSTKSIIWDDVDQSCFTVIDLSHHAHCYVSTPNTITGPSIELISNTNVLSPESIPLVLLNGEVFSFIEGFGLSAIVLDSHSSVLSSVGRLGEAFNQLLRLGRLREAWEVALQLKDRKYYQRLVVRALETLDLTIAELASRQLGDAASYMAIKTFSRTENVSELKAYCSILLDDLDNAKKQFELGNNTMECLELAIDLHNWEEALSLSSYCCPNRVPLICLNYAEQLEMLEEYDRALIYFKKALSGEESLSEEQIEACNNGIIKCELRCGNIEIAEIPYKSQNKELALECADILASLQQTSIAAKLYRKTGAHEKAVALLLAGNELSECSKIIQAVHSPKLLIDYARKCEANGIYSEASKAYLSADSLADHVRILLYNLDSVSEAFTLVRDTKDVTAASVCADFCESINDVDGLVEFLFITGDSDRASELAIANGRPHTAASFHQSKGHFHKALKLYLEADAIDDAIDVAAQSNNELLIRTLFDYLMGDSDGKPKDVHHLFTLYVKLGHYSQAAKTALIIAGQEVETGKYLDARNTLYTTLSKIKDGEAGFKLPTKLYSMLRNLHSYVITRQLIKRGRHDFAALMLLRVVDSEVFMQHRVSLFISLVVECQKAGLRETSFHYASQLMQSDMVEEVPSQYRSKIERIIRKRDKSQSNLLDETSPCPFCSFPISITAGSCESCKSIVPFCLITGLAITSDDLTFCPSCRFPGSFSQFVEHLSIYKNCALCSSTVEPNDLELLTDVESYLRELTIWYCGKEMENE